MTSYEESQEEYWDEFDELEKFAGLDGVLFVIHVMPKMFEIPAGNAISPFKQCLMDYLHLLDEKLKQDRHDQMGLWLIGALKTAKSKIFNKYDSIDNEDILVLQDFSSVNIDGYKEILDCINDKIKISEELTYSGKFPLTSVLRNALSVFNKQKAAMIIRKVVLLTLDDDPLKHNEKAKHHVRVELTNFEPCNIQFCVIGLSDDFDHTKFYKDLEILSTDIEFEDYKKTELKDLIYQLEKPSRALAKLQWSISDDISFYVHLCNVYSRPTYLKKISLIKSTNELATRVRTLVPVSKENDEEQEDEMEFDSTEKVSIKSQVYGGREICFSVEEVRYLSSIHKPGIKLIGFRDLCYDPMYHIKRPHFISFYEQKKHANPGAKLFFAALLSKCHERNLMIICRVAIRQHSAPHLYAMIPCIEKGGFYMYRIAYKENVRDLSELLSSYCYNDTHPCPVEDEQVNLVYKMIKKLRIIYNPKDYPNPKLATQIINVKTLALDEERPPAPVDKTLPNLEHQRIALGDLQEKFEKMFYDDEDGEVNPKKMKKFDDSVINNLAYTGLLQKATLRQMQEYCKVIGLQTSGKKDELMDRIYLHLSAK